MAHVWGVSTSGDMLRFAHRSEGSVLIFSWAITLFGFHFPSAVSRQAPGSVCQRVVLCLFPVLFAKLGFKRRSLTH